MQLEKLLEPFRRATYVRTTFRNTYIHRKFHVYMQVEEPINQLNQTLRRA